MDHTPSKKEIVVALSSIGTLALVCGLVALIVAATRPGTSAMEDRKEDRQKWSIRISPQFRAASGGAGFVDEHINEILANTETRHSQGKPRVDDRTVYYRDWQDGTDRVWNVGDSDIKIEPEKEYKDH